MKIYWAKTKRLGIVKIPEDTLKEFKFLHPDVVVYTSEQLLNQQLAKEVKAL